MCVIYKKCSKKVKYVNQKHFYLLQIGEDVTKKVFINGEDIYVSKTKSLKHIFFVSVKKRIIKK